MKKMCPDDTPRDGFLYEIEQWRQARLAKGSKTANDMADCMAIFASHGQNAAQAVAYAEHLFKQEGTIRLTTGHKAKGLEWDVVYHLDPWLLDDEEQDLNLRYVITTRAKDRLYTIDTAGIN